MMYSPVSGMNTSSEPARIPGSASGSVIRRNARHGGVAEILRCVDERPVDPLERRVERQHHQREIVVGDADVDRLRREEKLVALHEAGEPSARKTGNSGSRMISQAYARMRKLVQNGTMTSSRRRVLCFA